MPLTVKEAVKRRKEYYPRKIGRFAEYRDKLKKVINQNPNVRFIGVQEIPTKEVGILVKGLDSFGISKVELFYSLGDINFFFDQLTEPFPND